jgi:hypothetical protein
MKTTDIKNLIDNVTENLKSRWDFYRHAAYLKEKNWIEEQYQDYKDPDRNLRATRIKDYYRGYPYIVVFESSRGDPWTRYPSWVEGYKALSRWCQKNCKDKFRSDIHRVIRAPSTGNEWELNDIGGGDALFFVFKSQEDCFMFTLKWGGG